MKLSPGPSDSRHVYCGESHSAEYLNLAFGEVFAFTAISPSKDSINEDSIAVLSIDNNSGVLVVADGMGGAPLASKASELVVHNLNKALKPDGDDRRVQILDAIDAANKQVLELKVGAGTTCAIVEINKDQMRSYHAGDSSILVVGQRGKIKFQSISHSPVGYALEAGHLDEEEALHHEHLNLISNLIGDEKMRIDIGPLIRLKQRDTIILGSDGVFDNLYTEEIIELIRKGPLKKAGEALIAAVKERMTNPTEGKPSKLDDATFILCRLS